LGHGEEAVVDPSPFDPDRFAAVTTTG